MSRMHNLFLILPIISLSAYSKGIEVNYEDIFKVESARTGSAIVRYIKTFAGGCLYVQTLQNNRTWEVASTKPFCSFEGDNFWNGVTDASFEDIYFAKDGVHFILSITPLRYGGEARHKCLFPVDNGVVGDAMCGAPLSP